MSVVESKKTPDVMFVLCGFNLSNLSCRLNSDTDSLKLIGSSDKSDNFLEKVFHISLFSVMTSKMIIIWFWSLTFSNEIGFPGELSFVIRLVCQFSLLFVQRVPTIQQCH